MEYKRNSPCMIFASCESGGNGKKLLWLIIVGLGIVIIYLVFYKNVIEFEKEWTCEELGAEERLKELVSDNFQ